jgi:hypothetical protein
LQNPNIHYCIYKNPPTDRDLSQINPVHTQYFQNHFYKALTFTPSTPNSAPLKPPQISLLALNKPLALRSQTSSTPALHLMSEGLNVRYKTVGRDTSVGTATRYGLDGPRIEFRCGRDFPHTSRPAMGPTQPPLRCVPGLSRG